MSDFEELMSLAEEPSEYYYVIKNTETQQFIPLKFEDRFIACALCRLYRKERKQIYDVVKCMFPMGEHEPDDEWVADIIGEKVD